MNFKEQQKRETFSSKGKDKMKKVYVTAEGIILVEQLNEFVEDVIKIKKENILRSSFTYSKSYTARIGNLVMPTRY